jgi:hypothetical protein
VKLEDVVDTPELARSIWLARRRNGSPVTVCGLHLLEDSNLSDATPVAHAAEERCDRCQEFVGLTHHSVSRWLERVGGRSATEAGQQMLAFISQSFTATSTPRWIRVLPTDCELLLNLRWTGVVLVKNTSGGRSRIVTCLTDDKAA